MELLEPLQVHITQICTAKKTAYGTLELIHLKTELNWASLILILNMTMIVAMTI